MATITVRKLDADVQRRLKIRAAENNRSMEAEARAILSEAVRSDSLGRAWIDATAAFRGTEFQPLERSAPRDLDLT